MVLFNTKFILSDEFRNSKLIDAIRIRMGKGAKFRYDGQPTFMYEEDGKLLSVYNIEGVLAARILYSSKSDLITETYFVNKIKGGRSELSVTIENSAMLKPRGRKSANADDVPQVIRSLLWQELGGLDNGILTDDNATVIRKTDASEIRKSMIRMNQFINPVVYVSPESATGGYILDYNELASKLSGMAHVLVEANPVVSEAISFDGKPTDGGVGIFFPDGKKTDVVLKKSKSLADVISADVKQFLASYASASYKFDLIKFECMRDQFKVKSDPKKEEPKQKTMTEAEVDAKLSEMSELCESTIEEKDIEIDKLHSYIEDLEKQMSDLNAKNSALEYSINKKSDNQPATGLSIQCTEKDMYDGEIADVVLKALSKEVKSMSGDNALKGSRKYSVLSSIVDNNEITDVPDKVKAALKEATASGAVSKDSFAPLERLGFKASVNGNNHIKLTFCDDDRYSAVFSSTPSDTRSVVNTVSDYTRKLFGC